MRTRHQLPPRIPQRDSRSRTEELISTKRSSVSSSPMLSIPISLPPGLPPSSTSRLAGEQYEVSFAHLSTSASDLFVSDGDAHFRPLPFPPPPRLACTRKAMELPDSVASICRDVIIATQSPRMLVTPMSGHGRVYLWAYTCMSAPAMETLPRILPRRGKSLRNASLADLGGFSALTWTNTATPPRQPAHTRCALPLR